MCVCGRWPSPAVPVRMSGTRGPWLMEGSVSLFSASEGPYKPPQAAASHCVLARHSVPSSRVSLPVQHQGVGAFHTTDQSPSQEEEWKEVRGVCGRRKWYQDNGGTDELNRVFRQQHESKLANLTLTTLYLYNNYIFSTDCGVRDTCIELCDNSMQVSIHNFYNVQ